MVSIIILSYNTKELLKNCINSIFTQLKGEFEVIVVDNASSDGSVKEVRALKNSRIKIIENKKNIGFAGGCNIGAEKAKGEYLLFLNSDTEVKDESVLEILQSAFTDKIGVVGGLMSNKDGSLQRSFGNFYTLPYVAKMLFFGERGEMAGQKTKRTRFVDWVSGGFMMVKKNVYEQVGGFDGGYFMYMEDVDLCYRINKTGYHILVEPKARVLHVGQGSSNRTFAVVHIYRGLVRFYKQHRSSVEYLSLRLMLAIKAWGVIIFGTIVRRAILVDRYRQALSAI